MAKFFKNMIPWNKGKKSSKEWREKLRISHLGYKMPEEQKRKIGLAHKGKKLSAEHIKKQADSHRGTKHKPFSKETLLKFSLAKRGEKSHLWKGGKSKHYKDGYYSFEYKQWRLEVFMRDNFTCQGCKQVGGYLTAHHIKSFAKFPKLRFILENGITLCEECHKKTDNYKGRELKKLNNK